MANKYAQSSGNWSAGGGGGIWYDAATAGNEVAKPAAGDVAYIVDGAVVDIDENVSCAQITATGNTGYITVTASRTMTLTGDQGILYSGTLTAGFIRLSGGTLTITHDQGAATTAVRQATGAGYAIVGSGTAVLSVSNSGGTALENVAGGGCAVSWGSTGNLTIVGLTSNTGWSNVGALRIVAAATVAMEGITTTWSLGVDITAAATVTVTGNVTNASGGSGNNTALRIANATVTLDGLPIVSQSHGLVYWPAIVVNSGTLIWTGTRTLAAGVNYYIRVGNTGTILLATATAHLAAANSGNFLITKAAGGTLTVSNGAQVAKVTKQTAGATQAVLGFGEVPTTFLVDPLIPAEEDVELGSPDYGYAGDLKTGTLAAGGSTNIIKRVKRVR